ncbi:MAG: hypothetical protein V1855_05070, partial [bacterium]
NEKLDALNDTIEEKFLRDSADINEAVKTDFELLKKQIEALNKVQKEKISKKQTVINDLQPTLQTYVKNYREKYNELIEEKKEQSSGMLENIKDKPVETTTTLIANYIADYLNARNNDEDSALDLAAKNGSTKILTALIDEGALITNKTIKKAKALTRNKTKQLKKLLKSKLKEQKENLKKERDAWKKRINIGINFIQKLFKGKKDQAKMLEEEDDQEKLDTAIEKLVKNYDKKSKPKITKEDKNQIPQLIAWVKKNKRTRKRQ